MRLVAYRPGDGPARVGALVDDRVADLAAAHAALGAEDAFPADMLTLLRAEAEGMEGARRCLEHALAAGVAWTALADVTLLSPLPRPNSIRDFMLHEEHASGGGKRQLPPEWYEIPAYWKGNCDAVFGPDDPIRWPRYTELLDYELEIGLVIGRRAREVTLEEAPSCIAGYTIFNDWSARDIQRREMKIGLGPGLGKDFAFSFGPALVTPDDFPGMSARMTARINGEVWSDGSLEGMHMSFEELIVHLSQEQELHPGDVLGSGTIGGGCGAELDRWLQPGDVVELEVEGLGVLRNVVHRP